MTHAQARTDWKAWKVKIELFPYIILVSSEDLSVCGALIMNKLGRITLSHILLFPHSNIQRLRLPCDVKHSRRYRRKTIEPQRTMTQVISAKKVWTKSGTQLCWRYCAYFVATEGTAGHVTQGMRRATLRLMPLCAGSVAGHSGWSAQSKDKAYYTVCSDRQIRLTFFLHCLQLSLPFTLSPTFPLNLKK